MHPALFPNRSGAHRLACLSLYRALLRQCGEFSPIAASSSYAKNTSPSSTLRALVRHRFRGDRKFQNLAQIKNALQFGRNILQLLEDAAAGSGKALDEMTRIVSSIPQLASRNKKVLEQIQSERGQRPLPRKIVRGKVREEYLANKANYERKPNVTPVLQRPEPYERTLKRKDGRRKVPNYFVVQGIPILRYSQGTPLSLSRFIAARAKQEMKLWDKSREHEESLALADLEDEWDEEVGEDDDTEETTWPEPTDPTEQWADSAHAALKLNFVQLRNLDDKNLRWSDKLWNVHLKEAAMAERENKIRKEARRREWQRRLAEEKDKDGKETKRVSTLLETLQEDPAVRKDEKSASSVQPSSPPNHRQKRRFRGVRRIQR